MLHCTAELAQICQCAFLACCIWQDPLCTTWSAKSQPIPPAHTKRRLWSAVVPPRATSNLFGFNASLENCWTPLCNPRTISFSGAGPIHVNRPISSLRIRLRKNAPMQRLCGQRLLVGQTDTSHGHGQTSVWAFTGTVRSYCLAGGLRSTMDEHPDP